MEEGQKGNGEVLVSIDSVGRVISAVLLDLVNHRPSTLFWYYQGYLRWGLLQKEIVRRLKDELEERG